MLRLARLLPLVLFLAAGCASQQPPPTAELVPPEALTALLPDSVGAFTQPEDVTYRGYFADSTGEGFGVVTVARTYTHGVLLMTLNLTSTDDLGRYRALIEDGRGEAAPDSLVAADSVFRVAEAAGWQAFRVEHGWMLLGHGRAVEAKSFNPDAPRRALALVDLDRLAALEPAPVEVDSAFARIVE